MIDLMTLHNNCESCNDCSACLYEQICESLVDAAGEMDRLARQLKQKPMEDIDPEYVRRADLALKELFQLMGGV